MGQPTRAQLAPITMFELHTGCNLALLQQKFAAMNPVPLGQPAQE